jgi:hypothetical protein
VVLWGGRGEIGEAVAEVSHGTVVGVVGLLNFKVRLLFQVVRKSPRFSRLGS